MFPGVSAFEMFSGAETTATAREAECDTELVTSGGELAAAMIDAVANAGDCIVSVGSRSREPAYLLEIERALELQRMCCTTES
jgi:hypothetical protein